MRSLISMLDVKLEALGSLKLLVYAAVLVLMAMAARKKRWLSPSGIAASILSGAIILYIGGFSAFMELLFFFLAGSVIGKAMKRENAYERKGNERDLAQVLANSLPAVIAIFLYRLTPYKDAALIAYSSAIAEALADTWSGDFGQLSDKDPLSVMTFTRVPRGISGGVTAVGFMGGMAGAMLIALLHIGTYPPSISSFLIISGAGFLGSVLDSFLGASVQVHYRDRNGCLTEKEGDEKGRFERARGIPLIDNDAVNLISGFFSASVGFFLFSLVG